jgi:hypothetical protein
MYAGGGLMTGYINKWAHEGKHLDLDTHRAIVVLWPVTWIIWALALFVLAPINWALKGFRNE